MAGLKELRLRIEAIKETQKITSAMKLVAASRLRKVQNMVDRNKFHSENLRRSALRVLTEIEREETEKNIKYIRPTLLQEKENPQNYLLYVFSSDRGLCGAYNGNVAKKAIERISHLKEKKKNIKVVCFGKKAFDILNRTYEEDDTFDLVLLDGDINEASYSEAAERMAKLILQQFRHHKFDVCEVIYAQFESAISRTFVCRQVCPLYLNTEHLSNDELQDMEKFGDAYYEYLPDKLSILTDILPHLFYNNIFQMLVNAASSEHSARMTSMDSATRNADKMISDLTLKYNSLRQAAITTELIEIIAGAEAI